MNTLAPPIGIFADVVRIDSGTAGRISAFIERVFVVDYRVPFKAPDLSPLIVTAPPEPVIAPPPRIPQGRRDTGRMRDAATTRTREIAAERAREWRARKKAERRESEAATAV